MAFQVRDFEVFLGNDCHFIFDDFHNYSNTAAFTTVPEGSATAADSDAAGGVLTLTANATDENQVYVKGTQEVFKFAAGKPLLLVAKVKPVANTPATMNWVFGLTNAAAADHMQDSGAGPPDDYRGACMYVADGAAYWFAESSAGTTQTTVNTGKAVGNNAYDILAIQAIPVSSTVQEIHFFHADVATDGDYALTEVGFETVDGKLVAQTIDPTSAHEMQIVFGIKAGAAAMSGTLNMDWVYCAQRR